MPLPSYKEWPDAAQVQSVLRASGLLGDILTAAQSEYDWDSCIAGVVSDFEQATKHIPFLAEEEPVTVPMAIDRPVTLANLPASFVTITAVTAKTLGRGGSGETPELLTQDEDYAPEPMGAPTVGKPYHMIRLYPPFTRRTNLLLSITGRRGYAITIPPAAYQAVLEMAAVRADAAIAPAKPAVEKIKVGDIEKTFATSAGERLLFTNRADASWKAALKAFKKVTIS